MPRTPGRSSPTAFEGNEDLRDLARYPNTCVKVSSAPSFSNDPYPFKDIHGILRGLYDSFGPRRLLWGSDITRLTSTYEENFRLYRDALDFLSTEDKERILGKNVAEVLRWPEASG